MARGHQKEQARAKNQKKMASTKKGTDQKASAAAALHFCCTVCRTQVPDPKTYKLHFESKHPKLPLPPECTAV